MKSTMVRAPQAKRVAPCNRTELHDRKQLLQALEGLGGKLGVTYCHADGETHQIEKVRSMFLSCPRDAWVRRCGEPQNATEHQEFAMRHALQCWKQPCAEGPVKCVGRLFERWPDGPWVIIMRMSVPLDEEAA